MPNKTARFFQFVAVLVLGLGGGAGLNNVANPEHHASQATPIPHESVVNDSVHSITLPHDEPLFPPGPGREEFITACVVCHSPRYITMQPKFARSTWLSEVNKMKNTYGAHVSDEQVANITDYLAFLNGKPDKPGAPKGAGYGE